MVNWHCIEYYSTFHERNGNTYFGEFHSFERSRFGFDQFSIQFEGGSGREKGDERYLVEVSSPVSVEGPDGVIAPQIGSLNGG